MFSEGLKNFNRKILYAAIFTAFFGPAFFAFQVGNFHLFAFRLLWLLLVPLVGLHLIFNGKSLLPGLKNTKSHLIFLVLWLAYAAMSLAWAANKTDAIRQFIFLLIGISLIFFVVTLFTEHKDYHNLQAIWIITLGVILLVGFWNIITGKQLDSSSFSGQIVFIPTSVFHYQNDLATHLSLSIPFLLAYIRYDTRLPVKAISAILFLFSIFMLISAGSRINLVAIVTGGFFWLFFLAGRKVRLYSVISILVLFLLLSLIFIFYGDTFETFNQIPFWGLNRLAGFITNLVAAATTGEFISDVSIDSRVNLFRNGFIFLLQTYGFGVGAGNAEYYMETYNYFNTYGFYNPHNWWLEIAVNYGIYIFIAFMWYYISLIVNLFRLRTRQDNLSEKMISEALLLSLVIFFFAGMSSSSLFGYGSIWVLFAFATGFINISRESSSLRVCNV